MGSSYFISENKRGQRKERWSKKGLKYAGEAVREVKGRVRRGQKTGQGRSKEGLREVKILDRKVEGMVRRDQRRGL